MAMTANEFRLNLQTHEKEIVEKSDEEKPVNEEEPD
jgi:hypothetical protein